MRVCFWELIFWWEGKGDNYYMNEINLGVGKCSDTGSVGAIVF